MRSQTSTADTGTIDKTISPTRKYFQIMKLCYRGVSYHYNPAPVETVEGEIAGRYRGIPWRLTQVKMKKELIAKPTYDLYYRGVSPKRGTSRKPSGIPVFESTNPSSL